MIEPSKKIFGNLVKNKNKKKLKDMFSNLAIFVNLSHLKDV